MSNCEGFWNGGQFEMCKKLVELGADINIENIYSQNLLHEYFYLFEDRNPKLLEYLLQHMCIIDDNVLFSVALYITFEEIKLFVKYGANVLITEYRGRRISYYFSTKFHRVFYNNKKQIYDFLIECEQEQEELSRSFKRAHVEAVDDADTDEEGEPE